MPRSSTSRMDRVRSYPTRGNEFIQPHSKSSLFIAFCVSTAIAAIAVIAAVFCLAFLILPSVIGSGYLVVPTIIIIFIAFTCPFFTYFGWRGATRESVQDLRLCRNSMAFFLLFSLFVAVYICIGTSYDPGAARNLYKSIVHYHEDVVTANNLNTFQAKFKCCGIKNIYDWNKNEHFSCEEGNPDFLRCNVPSSCCIGQGMNATINCGVGALNDSTFVHRRREEIIYTQGCEKYMDEHIKVTVLYLEIVAAMLITFYAFVLKYSACVLCDLKKSILRFNRNIRRRILLNRRRDSETDNNAYMSPMVMEDTV